MPKRYSTALFAVIMLLLLLPFAPGYVRDWEAQHSPVAAAQAASSLPTVTDYLTAGYVGTAGYTAIPVSHITPAVLGVSYDRSAPAYQAVEVDRSHGVIRLNPGSAATVWVDFLNTGTATWYNHGDHFVAMNLTNPTDRTSLFQHNFWPEPYRPAVLLQAEVRPGEIGRFRFALQAPREPGLYREHLHLVAEHLTWIDGGYLTMEIGVGVPIPQTEDYAAREVERSQGGTISLPPGKAVTLWVDFENVGLKNWYNTGPNFVAVNVDKPIGRVSAFQHDFWTEYYYRPGRLSQPHIYTGERGRFYIAVQAPAVPGYYTEHFALVAEHRTFIPGGQFTVKFKVGNPPTITASRTGDEPLIRVGLYSTAGAVHLKPSGAYTLANVAAGTSAHKRAGTVVKIPYGRSAHWRIEPDNPDDIIEIINYENRPSWKPSLNDNTFRGRIEVRTADDRKTMWVINELPIEQYLRGLAEVSNGQPIEYLKSLEVAARSYALWHQLNGGKHPTEHFDINATTDQVYRGYGFEMRSLDPLAAITATAGVVITHPAAVSDANPRGIAVAAYSSGTDGRTRSYQEVWGNNGFPWLVSVTDPHGIIANARTLSGNHMVGLSASGARGYATAERRTFDWILQHYYTGVSVEKIY